MGFGTPDFVRDQRGVSGDDSRYRLVDIALDRSRRRARRTRQHPGRAPHRLSSRLAQEHRLDDAPAPGLFPGPDPQSRRGRAAPRRVPPVPGLERDELRARNAAFEREQWRGPVQRSRPAASCLFGGVDDEKGLGARDLRLPAAGDHRVSADAGAGKALQRVRSDWDDGRRPARRRSWLSPPAPCRKARPQREGTDATPSPDLAVFAPGPVAGYVVDSVTDQRQDLACSLSPQSQDPAMPESWGKATPQDLHRIEDRISSIYVERTHIDRDDNAVVLVDKARTVRVPAAFVAVMLIGPGTRITHGAISLLADSGTSGLCPSRGSAPARPRLRPHRIRDLVCSRHRRPLQGGLHHPLAFDLAAERLVSERDAAQPYARGSPKASSSHASLRTSNRSFCRMEKI
ncbi:hypothetical protein SAMN04489733_7891 [Amycolatopsis keratiniphila]|nr:hypothetical protein SAMN04489733_7891 [Amycolatopsis keratiniphila]